MALSAALALSAWAAVQTGSAQDEKVENVVPDAALESHEEGAELFLNLSAAFVLLAAAGFVRGGIGRVARVTATAGALGLVVVGARVGHSGGKLVYTYGAGSAYVQPNASAIAVPANRTANTEDAHGGN